MKIPSESTLLKILVITVAMTGCLTVFNAKVFLDGSDTNFAIKQILWIGIGILLMEFFSRLEFSLIEKSRHFFISAAIFLLILVLCFGVEINGMRGWFKFGDLLFQPSEFAKPFFILALSFCFRSEKEDWKNFFKFTLILLLFILPIILEPDYGGAIIYLCIAWAFIFLRTKKMYRFFTLFLFCASILAIFATREAYVIRRIRAYLFPFDDPHGAGWHILQFRYAIARGGPFGTGWGECLWANSYLPLPHSDSSFATLAEASGFFGTIPLMALYAIMPFIGIRFASRQKSESRILFILLSFFLIACQGYVHILVNLGILPPTGLTLPLFSYGGSSLISTMFMIGLTISASRETKKQNEPIAKVKTEADEENYEIQTSRKAAGIPSAVCRGFWGKV